MANINTQVATMDKPSLVKQLSRFVVIGVLNTGIDFIILNIEMFLTGITSGPMMLLQNAISFSIATVNSYLFNKKWTFEDKSAAEQGKKFSQFLAVSIVGISLNSLVVYVLTTFVSAFFDLTFVLDLLKSIFGQTVAIDTLWANCAKIAATGLSLVWNFIGYKFFVFKK